ncbi:MAG TPA: hypothetical protein VFG23_08735 [Polyangia bacterium]|nr:hypothetical protein [Polyangia bacterium]
MAATTKTLIDYFQPTPIICPLTSNTWGAAGVLPRDVCNGLEDSTNTQWQYWDGKILRGVDGKYHLYAGRWPQNKGFADWPNSVIVGSVSNGSLIGSYIPSATTPFSGKEQNVTGITLNNGTNVLLDSPGKIYESTSLADPWTSEGTLQVTANGSTISTATTENQSIWQNAAGGFLIISRTFQEMTSATNILGPYLIQATIPSLQSQGYEDPVVWCSGGQYHLVANMYNARKAMHFTSADGITKWTNMGLAYDPTTDFIRYTDGTINHWYKIERPGVFMEAGHVAAFTFAVIDVDKTLDLANDIHGTKIIVVPFDGVTFDQDNPGPGSAGCPADSGTGGTGGTGGMGGSAGGSGVGGESGNGGTSGGHPGSGAAGEGGGRGGSSGGIGGSNGTGTGVGGANGGTLGSTGSAGISGGLAGTGGGLAGSSGAAAGIGGASGPIGMAGANGGAGGESAIAGSGGNAGGPGTGNDASASGCSCAAAGFATSGENVWGAFILLIFAFGSLRRRRAPLRQSTVDRPPR